MQQQTIVVAKSYFPKLREKVLFVHERGHCPPGCPRSRFHDVEQHACRQCLHRLATSVCSQQTALERQEWPCTYLVHHELGSSRSMCWCNVASQTQTVKLIRSIHTCIVQALAALPSSTAATTHAGPTSPSQAASQAASKVSFKNSTECEMPGGHKQGEQHQSGAALSIKTSVTDAVKSAAPYSPWTTTSPTIKAGIDNSTADAMESRPSSPAAADTTAQDSLVTGLQSMTIASSATYIKPTAELTMTEPKHQRKEAAADTNLATKPVIPDSQSASIISSAAEANSNAELSKSTTGLHSPIASSCSEIVTEPVIPGMESAPLAASAAQPKSTADLAISANDLDSKSVAAPPVDTKEEPISLGLQSSIITSSAAEAGAGLSRTAPALHSKAVAAAIGVAIKHIISDSESGPLASSAGQAQPTAESTKTANHLHSEAAAPAVDMSSEFIICGLESAPTPFSAVEVEPSTEPSMTTGLAHNEVAASAHGNASEPTVETSTVSDQALTSSEPITSASVSHSQKLLSTKNASPDSSPSAAH